MKRLRKKEMDLSFEQLLAYAASNVEMEIQLYQTQEERILYGIKKDKNWAGCIGVRELGSGEIEIIHIAVAEEFRGMGMGREMIRQISKEYKVSRIQAETDKDAVDFYRSCGFSITSLGEKYPGVERFLCIKHL